jgi:hypothetical protein
VDICSNHGRKIRSETVHFLTGFNLQRMQPGPRTQGLDQLGPGQRGGRSSAAREFDEEAVCLAVAAHIRHRESLYDSLLAEGFDRRDARAEVAPDVQRVIGLWESFQAFKIVLQKEKPRGDSSGANRSVKGGRYFVYSHYMNHAKEAISNAKVPSDTDLSAEDIASSIEKALLEAEDNKGPLQ